MSTTTTDMIHTNGTALAPRGPVAPAIVTDEHQEILRAMVDRNATPAQVKMLIVVGNRYDLDPIMGHVVLINGKCFVTHKGLMHKAHASGVFDGIETDYGRDERGDYCQCCVYRKDMTRPFRGRVYLDEYRSAGPVWKQYPSAMGAKTAESFVLRRAFDVALTSEDEMRITDAPALQQAEGRGPSPQSAYRPAPQRQIDAPQRHPESRQIEQAPQQSGPASAPLRAPNCTGCGKIMRAAQATLSQRNYGDTLCLTCQKIQQKPVQPSEQITPADDGDHFEDLIGVDADAGPGHGDS